MSVLPIRVFGDPVLRTPARSVEAVDNDIRRLMDDMLETMRAAPGVGLAAPQVGVSRRVIVWEHEGNSGSLANPVILDSGGQVEGDEGCLSLPGLAYPVVRAQWVKVRGLDREGRETELDVGEPWVARIIQHEVDHVDGILFIDRLAPDVQKEAKRRLRELVLGT